MHRLLLILLAFLMAQGAFAKSPILPMSYSSAKIPFLDESLRDPILVKNMIRDDLAYEYMKQDISVNRQELGSSRGLRRAEILQNLYLGHQSIAYYLEDIKDGRLNVIHNYKSIPQKIRQARNSANEMIIKFVRASKNKAQKSRAFYHLYTNRYIMTNRKSASVASLLKIKKRLNSYLKRRVTFLEGVHLVTYKKKPEAIKQIKSVIPNLPKLTAISGRLVIAKSLAGLNSRGKKVTKTNPAYGKYLAASAFRSRNLSEQTKKQVFSYTVAVWRGAVGRKGSWTTYPFRIRHFTDLSEANAMIERSALSDIKNKNFKKAISKYTLLSNKTSETKYQSRIDLRIISLYEQRYSHHKTAVSMQKVLKKYQQKYADKPKSKAYRSIKKKHLSLINRHLAKGLRSKTPKNLKQAAITTAYRYIEGFATEAEKIPMETKIAKIYSGIGQHSKAVEIYLTLKERTQGKQQFKFINLALASQRILAKWPTKAPWNGIYKSHPRSREKLLSIIEMRYAVSNQWNDLAHLGLLKINLGRGDEAFKDWTAKVQSHPRSSHASLATGMMSLAYKRAQQWQSLEDISRLALSLKVRPKFKGKTYSAFNLLGDALFMGGKELFANSDWPKSIEKLKEFSTNYKKDRRHPESLFVLGQSYHNNANHPESIDTMLALVETYPKSKFEKPALLLGGEWAIPMAYEEQVIFFYQRFVNQYPKDVNTIEVRTTLSDLYLGRQIYGYASRIHMDQSKDKRLSDGERLNAALAVVDIEERFGEEHHAKTAAKQAKVLANGDEEAIAQILGFEARIATKNGHYKTLKKIERKLDSISLESRVVRESLAQTRMILAKGQNKESTDKIFNLELKNPRKTLDKRYANFVSLKQQYDNVCEAGASSYCAPAMMELADASRKTLTSIEDITMAQTLSEADVKSFETRKLELITYLDQVARESDDRALGLSEEGDTTPEWTREVQWANDDESDLDQSTSTSGNGYVQWSPSIQKATESDESEFGGSSWE